jgi:hypothetical protein
VDGDGVYVRDALEQNCEPSSPRRSHFADGRARYRLFWIGLAFWFEFGWTVVLV